MEVVVNLQMMVGDAHCWLADWHTSQQLTDSITISISHLSVRLFTTKLQFADAYPDLT